MQKLRVTLLAAAAFAFGGAPGLAWSQATADILGSYTRENGDVVEVTDCEGRLCGRIASGRKTGFEMLHGMEKSGPNEWRGNRMKHPDMPGFMTFNGTVTATGDTLNVRGCVIGGALCDAETWTRRP